MVDYTFPRNRNSHARRLLKQPKTPYTKATLAEAPAKFTGGWLETMADGPTKKQLLDEKATLEREYLGVHRLRHVPFSAKLMIRRVIYHQRICSRLELAVEYWDERHLAGDSGAFEMITLLEGALGAHARTLELYLGRLRLDPKAQRRDSAMVDGGSGVRLEE